jgi:hypothetical protein
VPVARPPRVPRPPRAFRPRAVDPVAIVKYGIIFEICRDVWCVVKMAEGVVCIVKKLYRYQNCSMYYSSVCFWGEKILTESGVSAALYREFVANGSGSMRMLHVFNIKMR